MQNLRSWPRVSFQLTFDSRIILRIIAEVESELLWSPPLCRPRWPRLCDRFTSENSSPVFMNDPAAVGTDVVREESIYTYRVQSMYTVWKKMNSRSINRSYEKKMFVNSSFLWSCKYSKAWWSERDKKRILREYFRQYYVSKQV